MHKGHIKVGTVEGTGAAINIALGFTPEYVRIVNQDGLVTAEWFNTMTAAHVAKRVTAGTMTAPTSLGVSPYAGSAGTTAVGFTIGADTDINVSGETIHYLAISSDA